LCSNCRLLALLDLLHQNQIFWCQCRLHVLPLQFKELFQNFFGPALLTVVVIAGHVGAAPNSFCFRIVISTTISASIARVRSVPGGNVVDESEHVVFFVAEIKHLLPGLQVVRHLVTVESSFGTIHEEFLVFVILELRKIRLGQLFDNLFLHIFLPHLFKLPTALLISRTVFDLFRLFSSLCR